MTISKTFNFTPNAIHKLPFSDKQVMYFDENKSFMVANTKLALQVGKRSKSFTLIYRKRVNGKPTKITRVLGSYPEMTLGQARSKFADEVKTILSNTDAFIKKTTQDPITFNECADFYINERKPSSNEITVINVVKGEIGHLPMMKITRKIVRDSYEEKRKSGKYRMANYQRDMISRIWNYNLEWNEDECVTFENLGNPARQKIRLVNPTKGEPFWTKKPSAAIVKDEQIKPLFDAIATTSHKDKSDLIKLFFYLGQHPYKEICCMRWDQIKEEDGYWWWKMERGFHKESLEHTVPLHPTVMKIINKQKGKDEKFVFVSLNRKDAYGNLKPYAKSGFGKQILRIRELLDDETITYQCFRATITTKLRELAKGHEPSYLFGQQLAGISNAVYTRSEFKDQKIAMVNDWMSFIEGKLNE